jgi:hypothetical protein
LGIEHLHARAVRARARCPHKLWPARSEESRGEKPTRVARPRVRVRVRIRIRVRVKVRVRIRVRVGVRVRVTSGAPRGPTGTRPCS